MSVRLDHDFHRYIVSRIAAAAPRELRAASREWRAVVDAQFPHWRLHDPDADDARAPGSQMLRTAPHDGERPSVRYLDVASAPDQRWAFPNLAVVRYLPGSSADVRFDAHTAIIFPPARLPDGFWDDFHAFPTSVKHLVLVFGPTTNPKRARPALEETPADTWIDRAVRTQSQSGLERLTLVIQEGGAGPTWFLLEEDILKQMVHIGLNCTVVCSCDAEWEILHAWHEWAVRGIGRTLRVIRWAAFFASTSFRPKDGEQSKSKSKPYCEAIRYTEPSADPESACVRGIKFDEWRDEVGETLFRLATEEDYVVA